jgi:hypothetical protein
MANNLKITACNIEVGQGFGSDNKVNVTYEDGTVENILRYFSDEISFTEDEFIGLTKDQAMDLFHEKDVAYLRS